jgi:hypothetical protein
MAPSVDDANDIFRAACTFSTKPFEGGESLVGESAFLKNLDAFRMLSFNLPLSLHLPHLPLSFESVGKDTGVKRMRGWVGRPLEEAKKDEKRKTSPRSFKRLGGDAQK